MALQAKSTGDLPARGLAGSKGVVYGPLPVWIYTGLLHVTTDLVELVRLRAALVTVLTALAIFWVARICLPLRPNIGALALLSPFLWVYSRQLWDNTFLIPLSALTFAVYLSFCRSPSAGKFAGTVLLSVGMILTHLMSASLILPLFVHFFWFHRPWIRGHLKWLAALALLSAALLMPYFREWVWVATDRSRLAALPGWFFPFLGGHFFSAYGIDYFFGNTWYSSEVFDRTEWILVPARITWLALPAAWCGMGLAAAHVFRVFRNRSDRDVLFHACLISLLSLLAQCAVGGLMRSYGHPHYFNATWMIFWFFVWLALSRLQNLRVGTFIRLLYGLCLAAVLAFLIVDIHHAKGARTLHYGHTLQHQIEIAEQLNTHNLASPVESNALHYVLFPHALGVLRAVYGWTGTDTAPIKRIWIDQRQGGRVEILAE